MIAIILAAGIGTRMRPLTDDTPKTLLQIDRQPIIGRIIDGLHENDVHRIVVVTGYLAETLESYLTQHYTDLTFIRNERYAETNNVVSLAMAFERIEIDDDILLIESDLIYEPAVIRQILRSSYPNVALVDHYRIGLDGTVVTLDDHVITSIIPPHLQGVGFDFSDKYKTLNIYRFSREFCSTAFKKLIDYYVRAVDEKSYYELILGILIYVGKETIHGEVVTDRWAEVDDPNDLKDAAYIFNPERRLDILDDALGALWNYDVLDFCYIRNMYFPPSSMLSGLRNHLPRLLYSYGSRQAILNEKLSWFLLCDAARVNLLNGMTQVYPILRDFVGARTVLIPQPTFGEYPRIFPQARTYADDIGFTVEDVEKASPGADVVVFVNPNNPTGTGVPTEGIVQFALRHPDTLVVVDESFVDFSGQPSILPVLETGDLQNVILVKSLSKVLGVPGLRLGYVYTRNAAFHAAVGAALPIWNSNSMAEFFLTQLLKFRWELAVSLEQTALDRQAFIEELSQVPAIGRVYPSGGNFVLAELKGEPVWFSRELLARFNIYVKNVAPKFGGRPLLRLAVRPKADRQALLAALAEVYRTAPVKV